MIEKSKRMMKLRYTFLIGAFFGLLACQNAKPKAEVLQPEPAILKTAAKETAELTVHPGKPVFDQNCKVCHQDQGQGVSGIFPPLTPNPYIVDKAKIIDLVLNGMKGKIEIDDKSYNGIMVPHRQLSDQQIADVISYVRSSFGNKLDAVSPQEVGAARK